MELASFEKEKYVKIRAARVLLFQQFQVYGENLL